MVNINIPQGAKIGEVGFLGTPQNSHLHFQLVTTQYYSTSQSRNPWGIDFAPYNGCLWIDQSLCQEVPEATYDDFTASIRHFPDVDHNNVFYPFIETLYHIGAINGFSDGTYRPDNFVTRAESSKIIILAMNAYPNPEFNDGVCAFDDVCPGHTFYQYIRQMKELGITSSSNANFLPDNFLSRGELSKFLVVAHDGVEPSYTTCEEPFPDVPCSHTFNPYIRRLKEIFETNGYEMGYSDGTYKPDNVVTRGEISKSVVVGLDHHDLIPSFYDVLPDNKFFFFIEALAERGITSGCPSDYPRFCPEDLITRGQVAKFIIRGLGQEVVYTDNRQTFPDVNPPDTFYHYIERLYEKGITSGFSDGTYRPNENLKREEIAKFIVLAIDGKEPLYLDGRQTFPDVPPSHTFYHYIERLYELGIVSGYTDGTYKPSLNITRAQAAKIIAIGLVYPRPSVNQEEDNFLNDSCSYATSLPANELLVTPSGDVDCYYFQYAFAKNSESQGSASPAYRFFFQHLGKNANLQVDILDINSNILQSKLVEPNQGQSSFYWLPTDTDSYYIKITNTNPLAQEGVYTYFTSEATEIFNTFLPLVNNGSNGTSPPIGQPQPSATLLENILYQPCSWRVKINLSNLAPFQDVTIDSSFSEVSCATGNTLTSSWTTTYPYQTDKDGNLTVAFVHQGTGFYNYTFTDEQGNQVTFPFSTISMAQDGN